MDRVVNALSEALFDNKTDDTGNKYPPPPRTKAPIIPVPPKLWALNRGGGLGGGGGGGGRETGGTGKKGGPILNLCPAAVGMPGRAWVRLVYRREGKKGGIEEGKGG
jgi:hypothetical protein